MSDKNSFKIKFLCWNVLKAECCNLNEFPHSDETALDWYHRFVLFQQFLRDHPVDLLYLTEVDKYQDFFAPLLVELKYRVFIEYNNDIVAYQNSKIVIPAKSRITFEYGSQCYIRIEIIPNIILYCVHLENDINLKEVRLLQVQQLLQDANNTKTNENTIILMGSFNDDPAFEVIQSILKDGYDWLNETMEFTLFKRNEFLQRSVKDYVFVKQRSSNFLKKESSVRSYDPEVLMRIEWSVGLPNDFIPSCHIPLISDLFFKSRILYS